MLNLTLRRDDVLEIVRVLDTCIEALRGALKNCDARKAQSGYRQLIALQDQRNRLDAAAQRAIKIDQLVRLERFADEIRRTKQ